jgi:hypothetical protein
MTLSEAVWAYYEDLLPSVGDRVYPRRLPQDAVLPAVCFQVIPAVGPLKVHSDAHESTVVSKYMNVRMQWDVWANTYNEMEAVAQELRQTLSAFQGYWGDLYIGSIHTDLDFDSYDQEIDRYRRIIDCMVQYNEVALGS